MGEGVNSANTLLFKTMTMREWVKMAQKLQDIIYKRALRVKKKQMTLDFTALSQLCRKLGEISY